MSSTGDFSNVATDKTKEIKLVKRTEIVLNTINSFVNSFLRTENIDTNDGSYDKLLESWNSVSSQHALRVLIDENKLRMRNPNKKGEQTDKENKENKENKMKQKKKKKKLETKIKTPFFFFRNEIEPLIISENPQIDRNGIYSELQKRWREIKSKNNDRFLYYKELSDNSLKNEEKVEN
jgi:hypothetical protein